MIYLTDTNQTKARILAVDDTEINLIALKGLLKNSDIIIDAVTSGDEALKLITKVRYDCMLIDHKMPNMSGIEFLHNMNDNINNKNKGVPAIVLSANDAADAKDMYLREGFTDFINKPVDGVKLEELLLKYIPSYKLKSLEVKKIDYDMALTNCGDEDMLKEIMENFLISIDARYEALKQYYEEEDIKNYVILVHSIKSSARLIGAMDISNRAAYLEEMGNKGEKETINKLTPDFLNDLLELKVRISSILGEDKDSDNAKKEIDVKSLKEAFRSLHELVEAFDFDGVDSIMDMLEKYAIPSEYEDIYNSLIPLVAAVDIDGINKLLDSVKDKVN